MGVQYNGKSPGKLWHAWQVTKALMKTPFNKSTKSEAKNFGKSAGITAGIAVAANILLTVPIVMAAPIVPWIVGAGAIWGIFKYGREAWSDFKKLKDSGFVSSYVRQQENKWYERKKSGNFVSRTLKGIKEKFAKIPRGIVQAAKWTGLATAVAGLGATTVGLLGHFGVVPALAPVVATVVEAGAAIGLTAGAAFGIAIGAAALAIPAGVGMFIAARNSLIKSDPEKSNFSFRRAPTTDDGTPIDQGRVFEGKERAQDFNTKSAPPAPAKAKEEDKLSAERRKAAEARRGNKNRRDNSGKF